MHECFLDEAQQTHTLYSPHIHDQRHLNLLPWRSLSQRAGAVAQTAI